MAVTGVRYKAVTFGPSRKPVSISRTQEGSKMEGVMPKVRAGWGGKYQISKHEFYTVYHYALQYHDWVDRRNDLVNAVQAIRYDKESVQSSPSQDGLEMQAIRIAELSHKIQLVERTAFDADPSIYKWILKAVTNEGVSYEALKNPSSSDTEPIPCGRSYYLERRRKFYWLLFNRID